MCNEHKFPYSPGDGSNQSRNISPASSGEKDEKLGIPPPQQSLLRRHYRILFNFDMNKISTE
jgi:hypothetical protein